MRCRVRSSGDPRCAAASRRAEERCNREQPGPWRAAARVVARGCRERAGGVERVAARVATRGRRESRRLSREPAVSREPSRE